MSLTIYKIFTFSNLIRSITVLIVLSILLSGCTRNTKPNVIYNKTLLNEYVGVWKGRGGIKIRYSTFPVRATFSTSENSSQLEFNRDGHKVRIRLDLLGEYGGEVYFKVIKIEPSLNSKIAQYFPLEIISISFSKSKHKGALLIKTFPKNKSKRDRNQRPMEYVLWKPKFQSEKTKKQYGSTGTIMYKDWRSIEEWNQEFIPSQSTEAESRLAEDLKLLQKQGWKCLSRIERNIPTNGIMSVDIQSSPGPSRLHVLYSHVAAPRVVYSASKSPPGYLYLRSGRNYPSIRSANGWTTRIDMTTYPKAGEIDSSSPSIPVSIFVLGNSASDNGTGCKLEKYGIEKVVQFEQYIETIGKVFLAIGFENIRRNSIDNRAGLLQALSTAGRNLAIESALRDFIPEASNEELGYFSRWTTMILSNNINNFSLFHENIREYIIQEISQENPGYEKHVRIIDFLIDLELQKRSRSK